jgi:hypothetical protein
MDWVLSCRIGIGGCDPEHMAVIKDRKCFKMLISHLLLK